MAPRAIIDAATFIDWRRPQSGLEDQGESPALLRCIELASQDLEAACSRRFLSDQFVALHSGDRARRIHDDECRYGHRIFLADPVTGYLTLPVTAISSVMENDTSLTPILMSGAPASFSDGEAVLVNDRTGILTRATISGGRPCPRAWASGVANIRVAYTAGYTRVDRAAGTGTMPETAAQIVCELVDMYLRQGSAGGFESMIEAGASVNFVRLLSPNAKRMLGSLKRNWSPQTLEA